MSGGQCHAQSADQTLPVRRAEPLLGVQYPHAKAVLFGYPILIVVGALYTWFHH